MLAKLHGTLPQVVLQYEGELRDATHIVLQPSISLRPCSHPFLSGQLPLYTSAGRDQAQQLLFKKEKKMGILDWLLPQM